MGKLIGNVHDGSKPRKVSESSGSKKSNKSDESKKTSRSEKSSRSERSSREKESRSGGMIKGVHRNEDDYVDVCIDDDDDKSSRRHSDSKTDRVRERAEKNKEKAQEAIKDTKERFDEIKESLNPFSDDKDNSVDKEKETQEEQEAKEAKEAKEAQEAQEQLEKTEKENADIEAKALKAAGIDADDVEIPEKLKGNYYGIYSYLVTEQGEQSHKIKQATEKLINDENLWDPSSMTMSREKLVGKLEKTFDVRGSVFRGRKTAETIVDSALENNINPELFAAKIMAENDLGTGTKTDTYKNPGWIRDKYGYKTYDTIEDGIKDMAYLLGHDSKYNLAKKSKSMVEVDSVYAPGNTAYSEFLAKRYLTLKYL